MNRYSTPRRRLVALASLWSVILTAGLALADDAAVLSASVASTPPRGWNSYDYYDSRITEDEFRRSVDVLAEELSPAGWEYAVIDYLWFVPEPNGWVRPDGFYCKASVALDEAGVPTERLAVDEYGRVLPAPERFPSAAGGKGFKPLADYVHSKGMKFGIHIMRGVPREAYYDAKPILGSDATCRDIADTEETCLWCNVMFGIDAEKPGAQEYYDSLFRLYASWGVDLVKADDLLSPTVDRGEVELIARAMERCGRPMVLSLSPGDAALADAEFLRRHSHMWRISADFWDRWPQLRRNFDLLRAWNPHRSVGRWPDADMLPIGRLSRGGRPDGPERTEEFTPDETRTMLTLWSIARSPLMWGGDPLTSDPSVFRLLDRREVLDVNTHGRDPREVVRDGDTIAWLADDARGDVKHLAVFNVGDAAADVAVELAPLGLDGAYRARDLWEEKDAGRVETSFEARLPAHGSTIVTLSPVD